MKVRWILLLPVLAILAAGPGGSEPLSQQETLKRIMDRVKENDDLAQSYGYYYQARLRKMDDEGKVLEEDQRLYRIAWIEESQYFELLKINDRDLNPGQKSAEAKRRQEFVKAVREKKPPEFKMGWDEMFVKYDYTFETPSDGAAYVVSFRPKKDGLKERTRMEKVFNHTAGRVWADSGYNVQKAHLWLAEDVRFGLGILGSLNELELQYSQQEFGGKVWLPAILRLTYSYRILLKGTHQQMESRFFDPYPRPSPAAAPTGGR